MEYMSCVEAAAKSGVVVKLYLANREFLKEKGELQNERR